MPDEQPPATPFADLSADRHRDLAGRRYQPWVRRGTLTVFLVVAALGLANVFGQRATRSTAGDAAAELTVEAPERLRGGLIGQGTIRVEAAERVAQSRLVLDPGWIA